MNAQPDREGPTYGELHATVLREIVETGRAPSVDNLVNRWGLARAKVRALLRELQNQHGAVLHPHSDEVWIIHPFSTAPTLFSIHAGPMAWWANCAWCSLGAAALLDRDCRIVSNLGGHGERVDLLVRNGQLVSDGLLIHMPVPMAKAWDNVVYTCSVMLLFERESDIDDWSSRHGIPKGDVRRVADMWPFAREWYGGHLSESWEKISVARARALFARYGLEGPIWDLPEDEGRF